MATMLRGGLGRYEYGSPPQDDRIKELEDKVERLEEMVKRLIEGKGPSFMDFKFIKEDEKRKEQEERDRIMTINRIQSLLRR